MVNTWKQEVECNNGGVVDIAVDSYLKRFSGDIISRACFGSNYAKGLDIFLKLEALQKLVSKKFNSVGLPGLRYNYYISTYN